MEDSPSWAGYGDALSSGLSNEQAIKVLTRTTGFAVAGGLYGSAVATLKYAPAIPAAYEGTKRTVGPAFAFFCLREYFATPTFEYLRKAQVIHRNQSLHYRNLPETLTAGFFTGSILGLYHFRAPVRALTGGFTMAILASAGQFTFNELNVLRVNFIKRRAVAPSEQESNDSKLSQQTKQIEPEMPSLLQKVTESVLSVSPIKKLSDEEYANTIKLKIRNADQELQSVKAQIEETEATLAQLQRDAKNAPQ